MEKFVVIGAGATGRAVTNQLVQRGGEVFVVTRSVPQGLPAGAVSRQGDAANGDFVASVAEGATALFNCANPPYHRWLTDWPPVANSLLRAAEQSGAVLATLSNLYAYGQPSGPMRPTDELRSTLPKAQVRAQMWRDALAAHEAGTIRAVEVRASDFIGAGSQSFFERAVPPLRKGKSVTAISNPDVTHSWTFVDDVARTLVLAALDPTAHGQVWHALTNEPKTIREVVADLAKELGVATPWVRKIPLPVLKAIGLFNPEIRELPKVAYQFSAPFVIDDTATRAHFGENPTPWHEVIRRTLG